MQGHATTAGRLRSPKASGRARTQDPRFALAIAGACIVAMAAVWALAELVPAVQVKDSALLHHLTALDRPKLETIGNFLIKLLRPDLFILWGVALVAFAISQRRPRKAAAVVAVMGLAPLTAELLKPLLAHQHVAVEGLSINAASWPSGHATAALALVLSALLVAPAALRPALTVLGVAYALAVGVFLLILAWHMPSDVIGGYLVAAMWTALAVAAVQASERHWPPRRRLPGS